MLDHAFIDRQALPRNEKRLAFLTHGVIEESHLPMTIIWVFLLMINNLQECQQSLEPFSARNHRARVISVEQWLGGPVITHVRQLEIGLKQQQSEEAVHFIPGRWGPLTVGVRIGWLSCNVGNCVRVCVWHYGINYVWGEKKFEKVALTRRMEVLRKVETCSVSGVNWGNPFSPPSSSSL